MARQEPDGIRRTIALVSAAVPALGVSATSHQSTGRRHHLRHWVGASKEIMATAEEMSDRVGQASGMVSVQADCPLDEALVIMMDRASVQHQTLTQIAEGVIQRRIRFGF